MSTAELVSVLLGAGAILGGVGYAVGQYLSGKKKGQSDALAGALTEIEILTKVVSRLESEMHKQAQEVALLRAENTTLRSAIAGGSPVVQSIETEAAKLRQYSHDEHEKTRGIIREAITRA